MKRTRYLMKKIVFNEVHRSHLLVSILLKRIRQKRKTKRCVYLNREGYIVIVILIEWGCFNFYLLLSIIPLQR